MCNVMIFLVFEAFKEDKVKFNWELIITILAIWSASLLQFCLVLTATKSKKGRAGFHHKVKNIFYSHQLDLFHKA